MSATRSRARRTSFILAALALAACGSSTPSSKAPTDPSSLGQIYKFADQAIAGWQQDPTYEYGVYDATNLTDKIDGGAPAYTSRGMLYAMYQYLIDQSQEACEVVAMDFGTDANATSMFTYEQQLNQANIPIPQFGPSVAIAYPVISGITVYAHFNASYLELYLTGYPDQNSAAQAAVPFLQALQSKSGW